MTLQDTIDTTYIIMSVGIVSNQLTKISSIMEDGSSVVLNIRLLTVIPAGSNSDRKVDSAYKCMNITKQK